VQSVIVSSGLLHFTKSEIPYTVEVKTIRLDMPVAYYQRLSVSVCCYTRIAI